MKDRLEHYLSAWQLSEPQPLAETIRATLYTVRAGGEIAVLKILSDVGRVDEKDAYLALQWWGGQGAARLLRYDDGALLLEYLPGPDLLEHLEKSSQGEMASAEADDQATQIIPDNIHAFHAAKISAILPSLPPLASRFQSLFDKAKDDSQRGIDSIYVRGAAVAQNLLANQGEPYVLHGDIHHQNIKLHPHRGWLPIDPKGLIGDRAYDTANALCSPSRLSAMICSRERLLSRAGLMAERLKIDLGRILSYSFAYACLSASWHLEDGTDPTHDLAMAQIANSCINAATDKTFSPQRA